VTSKIHTVALLARLNDLGVKIWNDGGKLRLEAPRGVIDSTLHQELSDKKSEIIELLSDSAILMHRGHIPLKSVSRPERLPLSFAQERLWFLHQLEPDSTAYSMPKTIRLRGRLDQKALIHTFTEIGCRHETLRTTFPILEGRAEQVIASEPSFPIEVVDLSYLPEADRKSEAQRLIKIESKKPFDLQNGPLFRVALHLFGDDNYMLHVNMHHMISDYWSFGVLSQEFAAFYTASIRGTPTQLPDLPMQYADYAYWQRQWLQGEALETLLSYWRIKLGGELATLDLPTDRPRPAIQTHLGASHSLEIPNSLLENMRALSRGEDVSLFMLILAAFKLLLCRYTSQEDIIVGTPIAGRDRIELEGLIGFFINTIVMRTDLSGAPTFRELLARVRETTLDAYAHQMMPFERLVEELAPERDLSRTPIFQVFFNHIRVDERQFSLSGLEAEVVDDVESDSKFDMTFYVWEYTDTMWLTALYNADLFNAERIELMFEQLEHLLGQIVQSPEKKIESYSLVPLSQSERLPDPSIPLAANQTDAVHKRFSNQALRYYKQIAVIDAFDQWSYRDLDDCSTRLANLMRSNGIAAGDTVAVYSHRSASLVQALIGILKAGSVFLILDPTYPANRLLKILEEARPDGWLQLEAAGPLKEGLGAYVADAGMKLRLVLPRTVVEMGEVLENVSETIPDLDRYPEDTAYIVFSSGSTGTPKGIIGLHGPLSLCIPDPEILLMPNRLREWMWEQGITVTHMTPALSRLLTGRPGESFEGGEKLTSLRYVFFGGETLTGEHVEKVRGTASKVECVNFFGTTETPQAVGHFRIDHKVLCGDGSRDRLTGSVIPLGRGIEGVQLLVLNAGKRINGIGEVGEIYVRTPHLSAGYLNDAELTSERFINNLYTCEMDDRLYKTGDLGRYRPDGTVEFCGRADQQVSIRGFRVELKEIETVLNQHPMISDCALIADHTKTGDTYLVAFVTGDAIIDRDINVLSAYLSDHLPSYMIPSQFRSLDCIPITQNGKVDFKALRSMIKPVIHNKMYLPSLQDLQSKSGLPETKMECLLADIWKQILDIDRISVYDNFFELGGHSLLSIEVIAAVEKNTGVFLSPRELVYETLRQLAASVENKINSNEERTSRKDCLKIFKWIKRKLLLNNT